MSVQRSGSSANHSRPSYFTVFFLSCAGVKKKGQKEQRIFSRPLALLDQKGQHSQQLYLRRKEVERERHNLHCKFYSLLVPLASSSFLLGSNERREKRDELMNRFRHSKKCACNRITVV